MKIVCTAIALAVVFACGGNAEAQTVDFGTVQLGSYKDSSVTVTNTYPVPIAITSTTMLHSPSDFAITAGGAPFTVLPSATHSTSMRFTPSTLGLITDSVVVVSMLGTVYVAVTGNGIPLPVELESFSAIRSKDGVTLSWRTSAETNNAGFEVQRAASVIDQSPDWIFEPIAFIPGNGTTRQASKYSYTDIRADCCPSSSLRYRLRQVDYDGTSVLTPEILIPASSMALHDGLLPSYPNPFREATVIRYHLSSPSRVLLTVHDIFGREVARLHDGTGTTGMHSAPFHRGGLAAGMYVARLAAGGGTTSAVLHVEAR